jgi:hypothetical protein
VSYSGIEAFAKRIFRDPAHAKSAIVVLAVLTEAVGLLVMLAANLLK